jgi:AcrR family transcriptional regulator
MTIEERRARERASRRRLITTTARAIAEQEGWDAVTTRRLSAEIEYSQPVIYKHFASLDGFGELADALRQARTAAEAKSEARPDAVLGAVAHRYASFATEQPAVYDAMFGRPSRLRFGPGSSPAPSSAFAELRSAVESRAGDADVELLTEVVRSARAGRAPARRSPPPGPPGGADRPVRRPDPAGRPARPLTFLVGNT